MFLLRRQGKHGIYTRRPDGPETIVFVFRTYRTTTDKKAGTCLSTLVLKVLLFFGGDGPPTPTAKGRGAPRA